MEPLEQRLLMSGTLSVTDSSGDAGDKTVAFATAVPIGGTSASSQSFTLSNTGSDPLTLNLVSIDNLRDYGLTITDDQGADVTSDGVYTIPAGASYHASLVFHPVTAAGADVYNINLTTDDPANPTVTLTATGTATSLGNGLHIIEVARPVIDGNQYITYDLLVGSSSDWLLQKLNLTLTRGTIYRNSGGNRTPPAQEYIDIDPTLEWDTYVSRPDHDAPSIWEQAWSNTAIQVTWFDTADTGVIADAHTARITVSADAVGSFTGRWWNQDTAGTGTPYSGIVPLGGATALTITDNVGAAGDLAANLGSAGQGIRGGVTAVFTLTNNVNGPLTISNFAKGGANAGDSAVKVLSDTGATVNASSFTIPAGEAYTVQVTFTPTDVGARAGNITFTTDDVANGSVTLSLSGTGASGVMGQFGVVAGRAGTTLALIDADGTRAIFTLGGAGTGTVTATEAGWTLGISGGTATTCIIISAVKGSGAGDDGLLKLADVTADSSIRSFIAPTTDLAGTMTVEGSLSSLIVDKLLAGATVSVGPRDNGDTRTKLYFFTKSAAGAGIDSLTPISSLVVGSWTGAGAGLSAPSAGAISSRGQFDADVTLSGDGVAAGRKTLGAATVIGNVNGGNWLVAGSAGTITVTGTVRNATINCAGGIGDVTAGALDTVNILAAIDPAVTDFARSPADFLSIPAFASGPAIGTINIRGYAVPAGQTLGRCVVATNISAPSIGVAHFINGSFASGQVLHVADNAATPLVPPLRAIFSVDRADASKSFWWDETRGQEPAIVEII